MRDFLLANQRALDYARGIATQDYAGFNLIAGDAAGEVVYVSNRAETTPLLLGAGLHAVSNAALETPWPKLKRLRTAAHRWLAEATGGHRRAARCTS